MDPSPSSSSCFILLLLALLLHTDTHSLSTMNLDLPSANQLIIPSGELEEIPSPRLAEDCALQLDEGIEKQLRVLYKPFGGNSLFFYDENIRLIQDASALYHARVVIFTNQVREVGQPLRGHILLDQLVPMHGRPSTRNLLRLEYASGVYTFRDEYSFCSWGARSPQLFQAKAYLQ